MNENDFWIVLDLVNSQQLWWKDEHAEMSVFLIGLLVSCSTTAIG